MEAQSIGGVCAVSREPQKISTASYPTLALNKVLIVGHRIGSKVQSPPGASTVNVG